MQALLQKENANNKYIHQPYTVLGVNITSIYGIFSMTTDGYAKNKCIFKSDEILLPICLSLFMRYKNYVIFRQHCWHGLWWTKIIGQVSSCCQFLAEIPSENEQSKKFWSSQLQNTNCMVSGWQILLVMKRPNDLAVGKSDWRINIELFF